jgi:hypothetical protein
MKNFDWAFKTMELLRRFDEVLCGTVEVWRLFNSQDGDLDYFSDISPRAYLSLNALQSIFQELQGTQRRLFQLQSKCLNFSEAVSQTHSFPSEGPVIKEVLN